MDVAHANSAPTLHSENVYRRRTRLAHYASAPHVILCALLVAVGYEVPRDTSVVRYNMI